MISIRNSVFETASSSVHSLIMCTDEDYKKLVTGEYLITGWAYMDDRFANQFVPRAEVMEWFKTVFYPKYKEDIDINYDVTDEVDCEVILAEMDIAYTLDNFNRDYYEFFEDEFVTPGGETVHAFGYFGEGY